MTITINCCISRQPILKGEHGMLLPITMTDGKWTMISPAIEVELDGYDFSYINHHANHSAIHYLLDLFYNVTDAHTKMRYTPYDEFDTSKINYYMETVPYYALEGTILFAVIHSTVYDEIINYSETCIYWDKPRPRTKLVGYLSDDGDNENKEFFIKEMAHDYFDSSIWRSTPFSDDLDHMCRTKSPEHGKAIFDMHYFTLLQGASQLPLYPFSFEEDSLGDEVLPILFKSWQRINAARSERESKTKV